jgi:uncharacterized protein YjeT (DUF2065 family)
MSFEREIVAMMLLVEGVVMFLAGRAWQRGQR